MKNTPSHPQEGYGLYICIPEELQNCHYPEEISAAIQ